jgi:hypothetical protein
MLINCPKKSRKSAHAWPDMRLLPRVLLRSRITAFRGWSAYRDQIGFVPDKMTLRAGGSGRRTVNSDANPLSGTAHSRGKGLEPLHRPERRLIAN